MKLAEVGDAFDLHVAITNRSAFAIEIEKPRLRVRGDTTGSISLGRGRPEVRETVAAPRESLSTVWELLLLRDLHGADEQVMIEVTLRSGRTFETTFSEANLGRIPRRFRRRRML